MEGIELCKDLPGPLLSNRSRDCLSSDEIWGVQDICTPFTVTFRTATGVWCLMNAIIGILGNLLTILAIPYAARKKK